MIGHTIKVQSFRVVLFNSTKLFSSSALCRHNIRHPFNKRPSRPIVGPKLSSNYEKNLTTIVKEAVNKMISAPAADRNKEPIYNVLKEVLAEKCTSGGELKALEIASGTGQHVSYFAKQFSSINWTPSDVDKRYFGSITAYVEAEGLTNVQEAVFIDITSAMEDWPEGVKSTEFDLIYNANMIHISPFETTVGLFNAAGKLLKKTGLLITYGPYAECGLLTPDSNVAFDESLRAQNPQWGVRDIEDLVNLGAEHGLKLLKRFDMPANNKTLVWIKE